MKTYVPGIFFFLFAGLGLWSSIDLYQSGDMTGGTSSLVLGLILMSASVFAIRSASKRTRRTANSKPGWLGPIGLRVEYKRKETVPVSQGSPQ